MRAINEIGVLHFLPERANGDKLIEEIDYFSHSEDATFSNINKSDFVLAHVGLTKTIVSRPNVYNDYEVKMNIALRKIQSYDFDSPVFFSPNDSSRTSWKGAILSALTGESDWETVKFSRIARHQGSINGEITVMNSLAFHSITEEEGSNPIRTILYAPVVRIDKFAEFRRNAMFNGPMDWSGLVTYWVNESFLKNEAFQGSKAFNGFFRNIFMKELRQKQFRIDTVPQAELNKLFYERASLKVNSLSQLKAESKEVVTEARNLGLVANKGVMIQNMTSLNRDYLAEFLAEEASIQRAAANRVSRLRTRLSEIDAAQNAAVQASGILVNNIHDNEPVDNLVNADGFAVTVRQVADNAEAPAWVHANITPLDNIGNAAIENYHSNMRFVSGVASSIMGIPAALAANPPADGVYTPPSQYIATVDPFDADAPAVNAQVHQGLAPGPGPTAYVAEYHSRITVADVERVIQALSRPEDTVNTDVPVLQQIENALEREIENSPERIREVTIPVSLSHLRRIDREVRASFRASTSFAHVNTPHSPMRAMDLQIAGVLIHLVEVNSIPENAALVIPPMRVQVALNEYRLHFQRMGRQYPLTIDEAFVQEQPVRVPTIEEFNNQQMMGVVEMSPRRFGRTHLGNLARQMMEQPIPPPLAVQDDYITASAFAIAAEREVERVDDPIMMEEEEADEIFAFQDELEQEAAQLQRTLEEDATNTARTTTESGQDSNSDVFGGNPAYSEEEPEIF